MAVITYTRAAKCKDCKFCERIKIGKQTRHKCDNPESPRFEHPTIRLNDLVCGVWKL